MFKCLNKKVGKFQRIVSRELAFCSFIMMSKANDHKPVDISREIIYRVLCFFVVWLLFFRKCGHWASKPVLVARICLYQAVIRPSI